MYSNKFVEVTYSDGKTLKFPLECTAYKEGGPFCNCYYCKEIIESTMKYNISETVEHI